MVYYAARRCATRHHANERLKAVERHDRRADRAKVVFVFIVLMSGA